MLTKRRWVAVGLVFVALFVLAGIRQIWLRGGTSPDEFFMPGRVTIDFRPDTPAHEITAVYELINGQRINDASERTHLVRVPIGTELQAVTRLQEHPWILSAGQSPMGPFASGRILVRVRPDTPAHEIAAAYRRVGGRLIYRWAADTHHVHVVRVPKGTERRAIVRLDGYPWIVFAEFDWAVGIPRGWNRP